MLSAELSNKLKIEFCIVTANSVIIVIIVVK